MNFHPAVVPWYEHALALFIPLFWLVVMHCLCDYPLQGDFLSRAKNHMHPIPGVPWQWALVAHSLIHAGAVMLVTQNLLLALLELNAHYFIDRSKSAGRYGHGIDQALHVGCKFLWVGIAALSYAKHWWPYGGFITWSGGSTTSAP